MDPDFFGVCPRCHGRDGYLSFDHIRVFYCRAHKLAWILGVPILKREQRKREDSEALLDRLERYFELVDPVLPPGRPRGIFPPTPEENDAVSALDLTPEGDLMVGEAGSG